MKDIQVKKLAFPEVKVIRFQRFVDNRGYFTETYRTSDFGKLDFMKEARFLQCNESFSKKGVVRGLHFQLNPYMGKLVRILGGQMIDLALDIRKNSPTFGKIIAYDMLADQERNYDEWIWLPVGFAHGNVYLKDSVIEYFCTSEYNPQGEVGISPLAVDIDWSVCDKGLKQLIDRIIKANFLQSARDKQNMTLTQWQNDPRAENFIYGQI